MRKLRLVKTRFAPSPTGPLHLGHARTHLVTYLHARSTNASIVMRIEDLDAPRVRPGATDAILRTHDWLGLGFDEGPVYQHSRGPAYEAALERLAEFTYPCTCSRKEIESLASAPHGEDGPIYPGTCRLGPTHPERPRATRFRLEGPSSFDDAIRGRVSGLPEGDFVIRRSDGVFAYQLAVVVDDDAQGITDVVRGEDLVASTPRQLAIFGALGRPAPRYAHVPLVRAPNGERLAKRTGARAVLDYRDEGVSREAVLGALAYSLGLAATSEPTTLDELVSAFAFARIATRDVDLDGLLRTSR